jgi:hypothetical protein
MKRINFYYKGWGRSEVEELCNILMPDEEIEECVNGYYDAGFALLVATKDRLLLVDKKPLGYLTVEDMRFDMINEFDLHHRMLGAQTKVSAGSKTLHFTSLNQARLRRLLNFVQARMTQIKKDNAQQQDAQKAHLEEMNEQLRLYLMAAHKQQFIDQANTIQKAPQSGYILPQIQAPAAAYFTEPQQYMEPAQVAQPEPMPEPTTPFEAAAAAAFESQHSAPAQEPPINLPPPVQQQYRADDTTEASETQRTSLTPQQIGLAAIHRVVPVIGAYTRMPERRRPQKSHSATPEAA